jgi:hypothetical protein
MRQCTRVWLVDTLIIGRSLRDVVIHGRSKERSDARRPEDPCRDV